jgi:hypothetical protein
MTWNDVTEWFSDAWNGFKDIVSIVYTNAKNGISTVYHSLDD